MNPYHKKLHDFIVENKIDAVHFSLGHSCHSVKEAAEAVGASENQFVKNICMLDEEKNLIVTIVKGEDRASTKRVSKALQKVKPTLADEEEVLSYTGYPAGGVPSFGFQGNFLIDPKVMEMEEVYTGGGSPQSLVKLKVTDLIKINSAKVVRVRK